MFSDPIFVHEDSGLSCNFHREVHLIVSLCKRKQKCQESDLLPLLYVNWKLNFPVNEKWMVQKQNNFYFHFRHIVFHVLTRATCKLTRGLNILETSSGSINWVMKQVRPLCMNFVWKLSIIKRKFQQICTRYIISIEIMVNVVFKACSISTWVLSMDFEKPPPPKQNKKQRQKTS